MILVLGLLTSLSTAKTVDRIAAVVNDDIILLSEVYQIGDQYLKDSPKLREGELEVLDSLIMQKLVEQELQNLAMDVTEAELDKAMRDVAESNGLSFEQLRGEVERSGLEWTTYKSEMSTSLRQMKFNQLILQPRIAVEEAALQDSYRKFKLQQPEKIDLYGIFVKNPLPLRPADKVAAEMNISLEEATTLLEETSAQQKAEQEQKLKEIQEKFNAGTDFKTLASLYDQAGLASIGGAMGAFAEGQLREDINAVAFGLEAGAISQPVDNGTGQLVLFVEKKYKQDAPPFEEVRPQMLDAYYAERFEQEMDVWFTTSKQRSAISIHLLEKEIESEKSEKSDLEEKTASEL